MWVIDFYIIQVYGNVDWASPKIYKNVIFVEMTKFVVGTKYCVGMRGFRYINAWAILIKLLLNFNEIKRTFLGIGFFDLTFLNFNQFAPNKVTNMFFLITCLIKTPKTILCISVYYVHFIFDLRKILIFVNLTFQIYAIATELKLRLFDSAYSIWHTHFDNLKFSVLNSMSWV